MANKFSKINWNMIITVATVVIAVATVVSLIIAIKKCSTEKGLTHQHVRPDISVSMEYPIKVEEDKTYRDTTNPDVIIRNNGPIKAVSLSDDVKIYTYNTEQKEIVNYADFGVEGFGHEISAKELEPFDHIKHSTIGVSGKNVIAVYVIDVVFHRESDMERFTLNDIFFTQNKDICSNVEFAKNEHYANIIQKIKEFDPTDPKKRKFVITKANEKTWFVESDSLHQARIMEDGKLRIIGDPVPQSEDPREGFPHLDIVPHRFSKCDCFIKAEIVGETVEAKIQHRVSNGGNAVAGITENGFDIIKEIEPGKESYYVSLPLVLKRDEADPRSVQEIFDALERGDDTIRAGVTFMYRAGNEPGKLFSVSVVHEFTKNSVKSIDSENNNKKL